VSEAGLSMDGVLARTLRPYRIVDYLTQGYMVLVGLLILLFHDESVAHWPYLVGAHAVAIVAVHALIQARARREGRLLDLFRCFYPMILYTLFYIETHKLLYMFVSVRLDPHFIAAEQFLFGCQPSRALMHWLPHWWVSEPLYLAYFSYYWMVLGVGLGLYVLRRERFARYVTVVSFVFYVCYLIYILLPVLGPYDPDVIASQRGAEALIGARDVPAAVARGPFFRIMALVYRLVESRGGAAFPSSHVAVAIATLCFTWRYLRRARWVHVVFVVLLAVSTVYCGYHYAVDVLAGALTAAVLVPLAERIYERTEHLGAEPAPS